MYLYIFCFLIFLAVLCFLAGVYGLITGERHQIRRRLAGYTISQGPPEKAARHAWTGGWVRILLQQGGRLFSPLKITELVEEKLAQADLLLRGEEYLFLDLVLALGGSLLLWLVTFNPGLAALSAGFWLAVPWLYLGQLRQKRLHTFNNQLGDALLVMNNSLRAGYSFLQALEMVSREMSPPIASEFGRALREMQLGTATEVALNNLSRRVGSDDLDLVLTALTIQRQVGGNLAQIMDNIAETIRERVRIKGEIKTLTAQGRLSGLIIGILPLALLALLFLINPDYVGILWQEPLGRFLLGAAAAGEILGICLIKRIVDIRV